MVPIYLAHFSAAAKSGEPLRPIQKDLSASLFPNFLYSRHAILRWSTCTLVFFSWLLGHVVYLNNRFLRERGMASNRKMEYLVFLCIFQKNSAMATYGLKEMGKFLWEGREKGV